MKGVYRDVRFFVSISGYSSSPDAVHRYSTSFEEEYNNNDNQNSYSPVEGFERPKSQQGKRDADPPANNPLYHVVNGYLEDRLTAPRFYQIGMETSVNDAYIACY